MGVRRASPPCGELIPLRPLSPSESGIPPEKMYEGIPLNRIARLKIESIR
jgi:hypothetical protein